jgi:hypothetical protein
LKPGAIAPGVLVAVWCIAALGIAIKFVLPGCLDRFSIGVCVAMGWSGVVLWGGKDAPILPVAYHYYIVIHQIEGNVIVPMVQRRLVFIPPAVLLLSIVAVTEIYGVIGIIFAAPITVIIFVAIKKLYVRDGLGPPRNFPVKTRPETGTYSAILD